MKAWLFHGEKSDTHKDTHKKEKCLSNYMCSLCVARKEMVRKNEKAY
jgi:hypothetical protein